MRFFKAVALFGLTASTCAIAVPERSKGLPSNIINVVGTTDNDYASVQKNPSALDIEFAKLAEIKSEMATIYARVRKQEKTIIHMLKQDFKQCEGIQCMLQMAMQNAPDFAHLIAEHFSHEHVRLKKHEGEITLVESLEISESTPPQADEVDSKKENPAPPAPSPFDGEHHLHRPFEGEHPHRPFEGEHPHPPFEGEHPHPPFEGEHPHRPFEGEHPHPPFEGERPHPPFRGDHPPAFHGEHPPPPPPPLHKGPPPPPHHGDGPHGPPGHHGHGRPSFIHHIRDERFRILKAAIALLAGSFLLSLLVKAIRKHVLCCTDPRRKAERASRREERRARCDYRRAAHRYRISSWWAAHNPRRGPAAGTTDYEEKRSLILQQEGILEAAMQSEIRNLQTAAELEEGRGRSQVVCRGRQELDGQPSNSRLNEHTYAPSDYSAPPPQYEEELDDDMVVVNGFGYTPSNTDDTPESSVVDFSPRMSTETLLTNISKTDRMD